MGAFDFSCPKIGSRQTNKLKVIKIVKIQGIKDVINFDFFLQRYISIEIVFDITSMITNQ